VDYLFRWLWNCRLQIAGALKLFCCKRKEVAGGWRKLFSEELRDLNCLPHVTKGIKLRTVGWAGHVECMGEKLNAYRVLWEKPRGR